MDPRLKHSGMTGKVNLPEWNDTSSDTFFHPRRSIVRHHDVGGSAKALMMEINAGGALLAVIS